MKRFQVQAIQLKKTVMVYDFFFLLVLTRCLANRVLNP